MTNTDIDIFIDQDLSLTEYTRIYIVDHNSENISQMRIYLKYIQIITI